MKMNKFFMGLGAVAALSLAACSSDEPVINGPETPDTPSVGQDQAYISVRISEQTQGKSRAEGDEDKLPDGYQDGTKYGESNVASCDFFFYDEAGKYVMTSNTLWEQNGQNLNQTIEQKGKSVVVLDQVKQTGYPTYMVTILNKPTEFNAPLTLEGMKEALTNLNNGTSEGPVMNKDNKNFIMTTTSWSQEALNPYYFVNKLSESDFYATPDKALESEHAVQVYVERLAAKATVKLNMDNKVAENTYAIELSVAGGANDQDKEGEVTDYISDYTLNIEFLGWSFNNTLKNSLYSKTINTKWTDTELGFLWNSLDYKRSYWGESWKYNNATTDDFNYFSYNDCGNEFWAADSKDGQNADYAPENTFNGAFASANYDKVTSVILAAKVTDPNDKDGNGNFVMYRGLIFKGDRFMQYAMSVANANIWVKVDETNFEEVSTGYELKNDGSLNTVWTEFTPDATTTYYKKTDDNKENPFVEYTKEELESVVKVLNTELAKTTGEGFQGGMMYYNIPIRHLRNIETKEGKDGQTLPMRSFDQKNLEEGDYGVVRNHYYNIVVNNVFKLGTGVWNPDQDIIDNNPPKDEEYYVGAEVNILAWRIVDNNVDL